MEEGNIAKHRETQASKIPGELYFWVGLGLLGASLILKLTNHRKASGFIGYLGESVLVMGLYNKKAKQQDHESSPSHWNHPVESTSGMMSKNL